MPDPFQCSQQPGDCPGDMPLQAMLSCASVPSWPHRAGHGLLAGPGEAQAPRHPDLLRLFPQLVISIAAGVCNYPQFSPPKAGAAWGAQGQSGSQGDNPPAGRQKDPRARSPPGTLARPKGCISTRRTEGHPTSQAFPGAP